ncbi:MAG: radical SAM protein [Deltaproteobacteria bacterium]|nr:radical SAM protein [Deltaproteobacteria bacterium]
METSLNHLELYRLPWNLCDNGISWLEPTAQCNLSCDGCYRENRVQHKPFEDTLHDLDVFGRYRKSDALSIAGGDPLLYPHLLPTIREAKKRGVKPVVNTNGHALTKALLHEMKDAGLAGFTFHVDSKQGRPGKWKGKSELELCALREELASMAKSIDVGCSFNATVYPDTLGDVPALVQWAEDHMDTVHTMVFILYRDVRTSAYEYFNGAEPVQLLGDEGQPKSSTVYNLDIEKNKRQHLSAREVVAKIRERFPDFAPSAYLNGTEDASSFKWLLTGRVGRPGQTLGYVGPKFQELVQTAHHLVTDKYLAYAPARANRAAKPALLLAPFDSGLRTIAKSFLKRSLTAPLSALMKPLYFQSVLIIQPIDMLADGRMNMCDACPDITVWNDELVWSCRMDEQERYGRNLWAKPASGA